MSELAQYTLFTNISGVLHNGLQLHAHAVVIVRDDTGQKPDPKRQQVRLFGPSASWPICDVHVPFVPYSLTEHPWPADLPKGFIPVYRTYDLKFEKNSKSSESTPTALFQITTNMMKGQPIAVHEFSAGASISEVWGALVPAVLRSWHAPYFPILAWKPVEVVTAAVAPMSPMQRDAKSGSAS